MKLNLKLPLLSLTLLCAISAHGADIAQTIAIHGQKLRERKCGYSPSYQARRFILKSDWQKELAKARAEKREPNPAGVYQPAPSTWDTWLATTRAVESQARGNAPLTVEQVLHWNKTSLVGKFAGNPVAGELKKYPNYGSNVKRRDALAATEIAELENFDLAFLEPYSSPRDGGFLRKNLLRWKNFVCEEDLPARLDLRKQGGFSCKSLYHVMQLGASLGIQRDHLRKSAELFRQGVFKYDEGAWYWFQCWPTLKTQPLPDKRCGALAYAKPKEAKRGIELLVDGVNSFLAQSSQASAADIYAFALRAQRALVALHPVGKGNGRISRWLMDFITTRAGLPPLIIEDHNRDLSVSESHYYAASLRETQFALAQELAHCR